MARHRLFKVAIALLAGMALALPGAQLAVTQSPPPTPPANDNFVDATLITSLPYSDSVDTEFATTEADEPQPCWYSGVGRTVWYAFTPATDIRLRIDTAGSTFADTLFNVYEAVGPGFDGLRYLGCRYFSDSHWVLTASAGTTYYIQAGYTHSLYGNLRLNLRELVPPPNDNFANAALVPGLPYSSVHVHIAGATTEPGEPQYCGTSRLTVWYVFTPSNSAVIRVSMDSTFYDTSIRVYRRVGPGFGGLDFVGCATYSAEIFFSAQAGETYYFQAGKISGCVGSGCDHEFRLDVEEIPPPPNDNFADAKLVTALPYDDSTDMTGASRETDEPTPCGYSMNKTAWYAYTPSESGSISQRSDPWWPPTVVGVYTGDTLSDLNEVACRYRYQYETSFLTFHVDVGTTYYFQVGTDENVWVPFHLEVAPPPVASFSFWPEDPSVFDNIRFDNRSDDPGQVGFQSNMWDFGDGTTSTEWSTAHRYAADGDYLVTLTVATVDGRTASTSQTVSVRTHDVAIKKFTAPQSASAGQTRQIVVGVNSRRTVENVRVELYKSVPGPCCNWAWFGALVQRVPVRSANRTTDFKFTYTFTSDDANVGQVTFRAIAVIEGARDAWPADNEAIALPTKVR